jgi:hypothetical protein
MENGGAAEMKDGKKNTPDEPGQRVLEDDKRGDTQPRTQ